MTEREYKMLKDYFKSRLKIIKKQKQESKSEWDEGYLTGIIDQCEYALNFINTSFKGGGYNV